MKLNYADDPYLLPLFRAEQRRSHGRAPPLAAVGAWQLPPRQGHHGRRHRCRGGAVHDDEPHRGDARVHHGLTALPRNGGSLRPPEFSERSQPASHVNIPSRANSTRLGFYPNSHRDGSNLTQLALTPNQTHGKS